MKTTQQIVNWFGDRGVRIDPADIVWDWNDGKLWFVLKQSDERDIENTDRGYVDITYTHRQDGSSITCYELYESIPVKKAPPEFQEKLSLKRKNR